MSRQDAFGGSSAEPSGSAGSGVFGFSFWSMTTVNSQSLGFALGTSSGSQASAATSGFATSSQTQLVPFGSSASSPSFGLTGITAFSLGSSLFPSSSLATNTSFSFGSSLFPSSNPTTSIFNFGTPFGLSTSGTSSALFGPSSWQPSNSPFGSAFSSSSSSGFSFGSSTASVASTSTPSMTFPSTNNASSPQFSLFTSAAATTSNKPAFGSPSPAPVQSNFVFGASAPSGASPFQFGSQRNIAPQSPSPFQASSSLEFNAGGSFSLGTGGGDKSGRRFVKVKKKQRRT